MAKKSWNQNQGIIFAVILFVSVITIVLVLGLRWSLNARNQRLEYQQQSFQAPSTTNKQEVKKIRVSRINKDGEQEFLEINSIGEIELYDSQNQLINSKLHGFNRVYVLFNQINRSLEDYIPEEGAENSGVIDLTNGNAQCTILVTTNLAEYLISCDDFQDISEEIEDIEEETFYPTPTPSPLPTITYPTPTLIPNSPTPIINPPTITPGGPSPTPTPLPDYMTAPPFSCSEYEYLGRPVAISNVICGAD